MRPHTVSSPRLAALALAGVTVLAACTAGRPTSSGAAESAPADGAPATRFTFVSPEPTVTRALTGIDESFINPGAIIEHEGTLHMFANVFSAWPGLVQVPHLTSEDGMAWQLASDTPAMTSEDVPFDTPSADVSTGFVTEDGTWVLIFETVTLASPWVLGRATAPGPDGPWTMHPEPILEPGADGSFDAGGLEWPSAVRTDTGYALYYTARETPRGTGVIGMATSADGLTWTKRDEPVLRAEAEWEGRSVDRPRVAATPDGFVMVYAGSRLTDRGVATSPDGVAWTRDGTTPAITADDFPVSGRCWDAALVQRDGSLLYYLEIGVATASGGTDVYLATAELP